MNLENKRETIIKSAVKIFVRDGFDKASIANITNDAGISKGSIYLYFKNKDDLIDKSFWHCHSLCASACDYGLENCKTSIEKLCKRARNSIAWALDNPVESQLERLYFSSPNSGYRRRYTSHYLHFEMIDRIVKEGIKNGEFKDMPPTVLGEVFYGIGKALLYHFEENRHSFYDDVIWNHCEKIIIDALTDNTL